MGGVSFVHPAARSARTSISAAAHLRRVRRIGALQRGEANRGTFRRSMVRPSLRGRPGRSPLPNPACGSDGRRARGGGPKSGSDSEEPLTAPGVDPVTEPDRGGSTNVGPARVVVLPLQRPVGVEGIEAGGVVGARAEVDGAIAP